LADLREIKLTKWDGRGLLLRGVEVIYKRRDSESFRQAWWVIPVDLVGWATGARVGNPSGVDEGARQVGEAMR
jgi:hypothetical protein